MLGVLFGTMAMIIVLSVFNGFDEMIQNIYKDVDPDIKIIFKEGALFSIDKQSIEYINAIKGVNSSSEILEYKMLAQYLDYQSIINVKGVDNNYNNVTNLKNHIILGKENLMSSNFCIVGRGLFNIISLKLLDFENPLKLSYFSENDKKVINDPIKSRAFYATAVFSTQTEIDYNDVIVHIEDLRDFLFLSERCSSLQISIDKNADFDYVHKKLLNILGPNFLIKGRFQQRPFVNKMIKTEKLMVYIIFTFILFISMLSLISSLVLLLMEKKKDLYILGVLGLKIVDLKNIFLIVGVLITTSGVVLGTMFGFLFCLLQQKFGLIKLASDAA